MPLPWRLTCLDDKPTQWHLTLVWQFWSAYTADSLVDLLWHVLHVNYVNGYLKQGQSPVCTLLTSRTSGRTCSETAQAASFLCRGSESSSSSSSSVPISPPFAWRAFFIKHIQNKYLDGLLTDWLMAVCHSVAQKFRCLTHNKDAYWCLCTGLLRQKFDVYWDTRVRKFTCAANAHASAKCGRAPWAVFIWIPCAQSFP